MEQEKGVQNACEQALENWARASLDAGLNAGLSPATAIALVCQCLTDQLVQLSVKLNISKAEFVGIMYKAHHRFHTHLMTCDCTVCTAWREKYMPKEEAAEVQ